jgi:drug/metabolite transporter (DMT)-like permease
MGARRAYLFLALTTLFWGGNTIAGKLAVGHVSPLMLTSMRWVIASLILLVIGLAQLRHDWRKMREKLVLTICLGALGFAGFNILFYSALNHTTAINAAIVQGSMPLFIILGNFLFFRQAASWAQIAGFVLSLVGIAVTASHGELSRLAALQINLGDGLMMTAALLYGGYAVALRFKPAVDWRSLMLVMASAAFLTSLPFAIYEMNSAAAIWPDTRGWIVSLYTAIFPAILSQVFFIKGVEMIGANRAGLFINLVPITGTLLSILILGESLRTYHIIALALVLGGIYIAENLGKKAE